MSIEGTDIQFFFQPFGALEYRSDVPILCFALEGQPDLILSNVFPEVEKARQMLDKARNRGDETVSLFGASRNDQTIPLGIVYARKPWRRLRRQSTMNIDSINFYREVYGRMIVATKRVRAAGYSEFVIVLPGQFRPNNIHNDRRQNKRLERFVRSVTEAVVYANSSVEQFIQNALPLTRTVTLAYLGEEDREIGNFFQRSINEGCLLGEAMGRVRKLTMMPSNLKQPVQFAALATGSKVLRPRSTRSKAWHSLKGHAFSSRVKVSYLYGREGLARFGLGLVSAVGRGAAQEPVFLKVHYRPTSSRQKTIKRVVVVGKGIIFDTGGSNAKDSEAVQKMHYDAAGAAMAISLVQLADAAQLQVEVIALTPLLENANGPKAIRPGDIFKAYNGKTVEVVDTDAEGRLIIADAVAYSERRLRPHCTITIGTLGEVVGIGPDLLKIGFGNERVRRKILRAENMALEKTYVLPSLDHLNEVDNEHLGTLSDLVNWPGGYFDTSPFVFVYNFFTEDRPEWAFVDPSIIFEDDADAYGAGPGFGLKFIWYLIRQYA